LTGALLHESSMRVRRDSDYLNSTCAQLHHH
jgi:hypothetical protein